MPIWETHRDSVKGQYTAFEYFLPLFLQQPAALRCTTKSNAKLCTCLCSSNTQSLLYHRIRWLDIQASIYSLLRQWPQTKLQGGWHCLSETCLFLRTLPTCFGFCRYQVCQQRHVSCRTPGLATCTGEKFFQTPKRAKPPEFLQITRT